MSRYIIHPGTLTVIDADECLILDIDTDLTDEERDELDGDDYFDDGLICEYAEQRGRPVTSAGTLQTNVCPVSEISGFVHSYDNGTHYFVPWSVMGDTRTSVRGCAQCTHNSV